MKATCVRLAGLALLLGSAHAAALCNNTTRVCRDTIAKVTVSTNGVYNVFVTAGDHETITCTAAFPSCFNMPTCTDADGFDLLPGDPHYDNAAQALLAASTGPNVVELTIDSACNIDDVTVDP
jgi:hypothetical protein